MRSIALLSILCAWSGLSISSDAVFDGLIALTVDASNGLGIPGAGTLAGTVSFTAGSIWGFKDVGGAFDGVDAFLVRFFEGVADLTFGLFDGVEALTFDTFDGAVALIVALEWAAAFATEPSLGVMSAKIESLGGLDPAVTFSLVGSLRRGRSGADDIFPSDLSESGRATTGLVGDDIESADAGRSGSVFGAAAAAFAFFWAAMVSLIEGRAGIELVLFDAKTDLGAAVLDVSAFCGLGFAESSTSRSCCFLSKADIILASN